MGESIEALRLRTVPVEEGSYLIGLSGGADSVALLTMMLPAVREGKIKAEAIHVNHGIRGKESDEDECFCVAFCKKAGIPLYVCKVDLSGRKDEASAREARYGAFRERYMEMRPDALILAHNANDQAETFLMRLLRGTGPDGLECMKTDETVCGIRILRPMLKLGREEIRDALRLDGISWREDASNHDMSFLRNRIREELIPVLTRISASAIEKICNSASLTGEDNSMLNAQAKAILNRISHQCVLDADKLAAEPAALRKRVLRCWWKEQGPVLKEQNLNATQTEALNRLLDVSRGKINLPGGVHAVRSGKHLFLTGLDEDVPEAVTVTGPETVFGSFRLTESASEGSPGDGKRTQEVPEGFIRNCVIRTRRPGDRIRPFGCSGSRKLQDYMTDRRIAEPFRDRVPLLCRGSEVLLVCGIGAGDIPAWDRQSCPVRLTWHGDTPWSE